MYFLIRMLFIILKANCYRNTNLKKRHFAAHALKRSRMDYKLVRRYGFNIGKHLWRTCHNKNKRDKGFYFLLAAKHDYNTIIQFHEL